MNSKLKSCTHPNQESKVNLKLKSLKHSKSIMHSKYQKSIMYSNKNINHTIKIK